MSQEAGQAIGSAARKAIRHAPAESVCGRSDPEFDDPKRSKPSGVQILEPDLRIPDAMLADRHLLKPPPRTAPLSPLGCRPRTEPRLYGLVEGRLRLA